ncbi:MAG: ABC transporter substrate-binding protein [Deltaproteobacteria bacterium]|nr:MAG: ABC transporter substrate-binding protein [Deltaproteobacteria bacterium]
MPDFASPRSRRLILAALVSAALAVPILKATRASAADKGPIRIGFLTVKTGALAAGGRQMEEGLALYLDQHQGQLAGRKIEVVTLDTAGQPATTKTRTQEAVERYQVHAIIGPLAAFEALAINDYVKQAKVPVISPSAAAEDLTQRNLNPWFVRAVTTSAQMNHPLGEYAAKVLKYKRIATIGDDFAFGHETTAGFQRTFEENGGKIVQKLWSPLNVADYGSYVGDLKTDVDAVYASFAGANGLRFLRQYAEYGLKGKVPVLGNMTTVDEGILKNMGDEAVGVVSSGWYSAAIDNPENHKFVEAYRKKYDADPGYYSAGAYTAAFFLDLALQKIKGNIEDKDAFMKALRSLDIKDSFRGPMHIDKYGNPDLTIYIRKVERKNGRLVNAVVQTYPNVSQFWKMSPQDFLKSPVYSRSFPEAKNLEK